MAKVVVPKVAIDSCVFVNVLCRGDDPGEPERFPHSVQVFEAVASGGLQAIISALVPAEVLGAHSIRGTAEKRDEMYRRRKDARAWLTNGNFMLVEVERTIVEQAADLAHTHQLKGADAVILASAIEAACDVLYTWDDDLLKVEGRVDVAIRTPDAYIPGGDPDLFALAESGEG
ncbi:type II toxin-antitoxin system VapC family toxin [Pseudactinotalea sp. Z1739]|uniref:type II toxin-antitoxin system VapC family toxin n=1 Tax=Pseudactinotalea sp. Z1739 TaxID=3413028 RepID=UPI003C7A3205